jgi:hypothetical protein
MAPYERSEGPLSIKNIGFKYSIGISGKDSILVIRLDAHAKVGLVEFAILRLTLSLNFASTSKGELLVLLSVISTEACRYREVVAPATGCQESISPVLPNTNGTIIVTS